MQSNSDGGLRSSVVLEVAISLIACVGVPSLVLAAVGGTKENF